MNKKMIILLLLSLSILAFCEKNEPNIIPKDIYNRLCGVWYDIPPEKIDNSVYNEKDFSWGKAKYIVNGTYEIDLGAKKPTIRVVGFGYFPIQKVIRKTENIIVFKTIYPEDNKEYQYVIHLNNDGTIWFEEAPFFGDGSTGPNVKFYRISGPGIN